ncbi:kinase-like domain-containing protein [Chlamydoabsidia padenii]|nr:kinase-like domain-containing protein [Chlamydoabsidia padenii]
MINDSLLQLFNSEFFNAWIAVSYLFKYSDNDDIGRYLCASLKEFPFAEIEFFLPQLLHLLVTQPTVSVTLEKALVDMGKQSPHFAVMSIWYLQTYMSDLKGDSNSSSYLLCQRVLNKIQDILMLGRLQAGDNHDELITFTRSAGIEMKAWHNGISSTQQQYERSTSGLNNNDDLLDDLDILSPTCFSSRRLSQRSMTFSDDSPDPSTTSLSLEYPQGEKIFSLSQYLVNNLKWPHHTPFQGLHGGLVCGHIGAEGNGSSLDVTTRIMGSSSVPINDGHPPSPASFSNIKNVDYLIHGQTTHGIRHSLSLPYIPKSTYLKSQHDNVPGHLLPALEPSSSASSYSSSRTSMDISTISTNNTYNNIDLVNKHHWIHAGYFQDEMYFLAALSDIAERLVAVPKHARTSVLHTELVLINHRLPAQICLPLWCSGICSSLHHHVVRVSPYDAVVLNSAERAPYLLLIEVLEDDMNLDHETTNDSLPAMDRQNSKDVYVKMDLSIPGSTKKKSHPNISTQTTNAIDISNTTSNYSRHMRAATITLAQIQIQQQKHDINDPHLVTTQTVQQRVIDQMLSLETAMTQRSATQHPINIRPSLSVLQPDSREMDDPSAVVLSEDWQIKKERIRRKSPFGHLPNWRLLSVIVKQGTDLRQEQFTIQLIREMQKIWHDSGVDAWVKYYRVLVTSDNSGLIETIRNTISVHSIKKNAYTKQNNTKYTLRDFFKQRWGSPSSSTFKAAQEAFMKSLVGYSVACYLLQIKDRHNGNLLLDDQGHLIHIDFGFVLSNTPGSLRFEKAPFKLSQEYIDVLDGMDSELFGKYRILMKQAFKAVRKYSDNILLLVEMMSRDSNMPCFQSNPDHVLKQLKERFQPNLTDSQLDNFVEKLILNSCGSLYTRLYDTFQYYSQGIL